jgi:murein DD-endopeptidase MepM/ murein hydrolase activator NlpD
MSLSFQKNLGSACHQRSQAQVPICLVTTLKHDELLFAHVPVGAGDSTWVVQSMSCSVQRFWNASTATLKITTAAEDANYFAPPFPNITNPLDNITHPLGPEDSICIWLGYTDELFKNPLELIKGMEGDNPSFIRVFVGIVDTIGVVGTDAGFNCTIQCRDRMRYMMETQVSLSPFDIQNDRSYMNLALGGTKEAVTRSETILRLAQLGIGHIAIGKDAKDTVDVNGMRIERGDIKDLGLIVGERKAENKVGQPLSANLDNKTAMPPPNYFYAYGKKPLASRVTTATLDIESYPKFNIFTSRLPFSTESVAKEYTIEQQIPVELIKWLSNQEAYPTELFSNPQDGNYYYIPRSCDLGGLADPLRFHRTYFYRYQPPDLGNASVLDELAKKYPPIKIGSNPNGVEVDPTTPFRFTPDWAQGIINWREELTTNAMYTNYIIANNSPNSTKAGQVILMSMSVRPPFLSGRAIAGRNMYIVDETINDRQEALAVGLQMARIHSKETRAASMTLIGDPSMVPGEVVQVVGSPLHRELSTLDPLINERRGIVEYLDRETQVYADIVTKTKNWSKEEEKGIAVNGANSTSNQQNTYTNLPKGLGVCIGGNVASQEQGGTPQILRAVTEKDRGCIFFNDKPTDTPLPAQAPVLSATEAAKANPSSTGSILSGGNTSLSLDANADQSKMIYPLTKGFPVTSIVGQRWGKPHNGIDIGCKIGASVVAALDGKVIVAGVQSGYGNVVYLDHGNNFTSRYGHLSRIDVKVGDNVKQGSVIALSGNSGKSTGAHLHFELRSYSKAVTPTFMTFSIGSTPTARQIADRIKAVGTTSTLNPTTSSVAAPAVTTPASDSNKPAIVNGTPLPQTGSTPADTTTEATAPIVATEYKVDKYEPYPDEIWKKSHYNQEPQSLFRVDAVRHDFNAAGKALAYSIEVVLLPITG